MSNTFADHIADKSLIGKTTIKNKKDGDTTKQQ